MRIPQLLPHSLLARGLSEPIKAGLNFLPFLNFSNEEWQRYMGDMPYRKTCSTHSGRLDADWPFREGQHTTN